MRRLAVGMAIFSIAVVAVSWARADDKDIAREITTRLKQEQEEGNLWGFDINLQVGQGTVVLKGHVASQEQQQLALDVAREIEGVKKVVDQLQIQAAAPADDDSITSAVAEKLAALKASGQMTDFRIGVGVTDGSADLNGSVASEEQKQLALDAARTTPGVRRVVDQLAVLSTAAPAEASLKSPEVVVFSRAAAESQSGTPTASYERPHVPQLEPQPLQMTTVEPQRAKVIKAMSPQVPAAVATPTPVDPVAVRTERASTGPNPSATPVENAIYRHEAKDRVPADQQIGAQLMQQLQAAKQDGQLRGFGIGVHVHDGVVRLTGRVSSSEQQQLALDVARRIQGVREVINELTIGELAPVSGSAGGGEDLQAVSLQIAQSLGQRLQEHEAKGYLAGCDFDVKVEHANVRLSGSVASAQQEHLVLQIARQIPGVRQVEGDLRIVEDPRAARLAAMPVSLSGPPAHAPAYPRNEVAGPTYMPYPSGPLPAAEMMVDQTPRPLGPARAVARAGAAVVAAPLAALHHPHMGGGGHHGHPMGAGGMPGDMYGAGGAPAYLPGGVVPARYDHPNLPGYAWPSYAAYPNYAAVTYPKQYSPTAWPYIGPFYPYPQVPLGWRKVTLKWDDGWWQLNFKSK